ncbi:hypothetical protein EJ05DRAFT_457150 [Pseudovirgaria hyperparasitica]|uniref:HCP-like protein n=1 Tax=Pseudovirgaria hyperparasitica TaxID=470096 RepID=A0A6A6VYG4_9PEZI|nr:uncharacterized protein EJ05DRAFT_457150 [Pseudovirgaria hyperparasitica]KAF2754337.1 hypothetical protein EJ05DRAFT_457150 [Pseudovirgaria hyperparasitica]
MAKRPDYIDLRAHSYDSTRSNYDLPSPRTGEIPPALSPLDAFALQSRMLARHFEQPNKNGRRLSRLPPNTVESQFGRSRPFLTRTITETAADEYEPDTSAEQIITPEKVENRHKSFYPVIQSDDALLQPTKQSSHFKNELSPVGEGYSPTQGSESQIDYFQIPRALSPDFLDGKPANESRDVTPNQRDHSYPPRDKPRKLTVSSIASGGSGNSGRYSPSPHLLPLPQASPGIPKSPRSIRSVPVEPTDDFDGLSLGGSYDSLPTQHMSSNSSFSNRAPSPFSPMIGSSIPRSPSVSSEYSVGGSRLGRPSFNFSRPLSARPSFDARTPIEPPPRHTLEHGHESRPSLEVPIRQGSGDSSQHNYPLHEVHTPVSMTSDEYHSAREDDPHGTAGSYIYSKYSLPRGRALQRESIGPAEFMNKIWENPSNRTSVTGATSARPHSPPSPPRTGNSMPEQKDSLNTVPISTRGASFDEQVLARPSQHVSNPSAPSIASSNSTIKASATASPSTASKPMSDWTAEEHLEKGIECHESGSLQKSTYHLRFAARGGHPTGMLLYALACRHGWGMRPNQAEGVKWLKQAVDLAQSEVAEDENSTKQGKPHDRISSKTHKAQFALGIYELGVSYMNGWGINQDKKMALRCFEIAGNWGDADALAEAGYCYTEGIGAKKDMKKAAKFYRAAEAKGISMVGNNWIYKDKYMDQDGAAAAAASTDDSSDRRPRTANKDPSSTKKPRDKSRTRTIFGRKKSIVASSSSSSAADAAPA